MIISNLALLKEKNVETLQLKSIIEVRLPHSLWENLLKSFEVNATEAHSAKEKDLD